MSPLLTIAVAFILAVAAEGGVEVLFGQPLNFIKKLEPYKPMILTYIGVAAGVALAIYYKVDLVYSLSTLAQEAGLQPTPVGFILSGLVIGRGSNAVHDFISKVLTGKPALPVVVKSA